MEYKLNSFKTFKDNGLLVVIGMIIAYVMMLIPLCWGNWQGEEKKAESETETAGTMESEFPFAITSNNKFCEGEIAQELRNIISGVQDEDGFRYLMFNGRCDYEDERIDRAYNQRNAEWYPGKLTASGDSQQMPDLIEKTSHDRFKELCYKYGLNPSAIWEVENKYNIREGVILAIIIAETSGGKFGYGIEGCWNYGNVGNNDSGDRYCFTSESEGLNKIGKTLNNNLLGTTQTLGCLSKAGSCTWRENKGHIYASSDGNWERTMLNVLNAIYQEELGSIEPERFNVRRVFTIYQ